MSYNGLEAISKCIYALLFLRVVVPVPCKCTYVFYPLKTHIQANDFLASMACK